MVEFKDNVFEQKASVREARLQAECERLRTHLFDWEKRYNKEIEWFHQQVDEIKSLADKRVEEKDKEIQSLKKQVQELRDEVDKEFSKSLNKVHDMESVWQLQEALIQKRSRIEAEALERETKFSKEKQEWFKQVEDIKKRSGDVLKKFEEEYIHKREELEKEYNSNLDELSRKEELLRDEEDKLKGSVEQHRRTKEEIDKQFNDLKKEIEEEKKKPKFNPPAFYIMPLVRESLEKPVLPGLITALSRQVENKIGNVLQSIPQKFQKEVSVLQEPVKKIFNDVVASVEPLKLSLQMASLPLICDETLKRFEQSFAERNIEVKRQYGDAIPHLMLDPKKTSDAFISILQNAYDAMVEGGSLTVSITHDKKADTVKVIFEDRGGGIRQEHLSKVFDPFFTTKKDAIGLGLYISRLILNTMNVGILVESSGRIGTTVTCVFEMIQKS